MSPNPTWVHPSNANHQKRWSYSYSWRVQSHRAWRDTFLVLFSLFLFRLCVYYSFIALDFFWYIQVVQTKSCQNEVQILSFESVRGNIQRHQLRLKVCLGPRKSSSLNTTLLMQDSLTTCLSLYPIFFWYHLLKLAHLSFTLPANKKRLCSFWV